MVKLLGVVAMLVMAETMAVICYIGDCKYWIDDDDADDDAG